MTGFDTKEGTPVPPSRTRSWEQVVDFHGHICPGLLIGYQAARLAQACLDIRFAHDEEIVCVSENDACGVDAIQMVLGCSVGRGNLRFDLRGKSAYSFYDRTSGRSLRLLLKSFNRELDRAATFARLRDAAPEDLFEIQDVRRPLPERARIFRSRACTACGEATAEPWLRLVDGDALCLDCCEQAHSGGTD